MSRYSFNSCWNLYTFTIILSFTLCNSFQSHKKSLTVITTPTFKVVGRYFKYVNCKKFSLFYLNFILLNNNRYLSIMCISTDSIHALILCCTSIHTPSSISIICPWKSTSIIIVVREWPQSGNSLTSSTEPRKSSNKYRLSKTIGSGVCLK